MTDHDSGKGQPQPSEGWDSIGGIEHGQPQQEPACPCSHGGHDHADSCMVCHAFNEQAQERQVGVHDAIEIADLVPKHGHSGNNPAVCSICFHAGYREGVADAAGKERNWAERIEIAKQAREGGRILREFVDSEGAMSEYEVTERLKMAERTIHLQVKTMTEALEQRNIILEELQMVKAERDLLELRAIAVILRQPIFSEDSGYHFGVMAGNYLTGKRDEELVGDSSAKQHLEVAYMHQRTLSYTLAHLKNKNRELEAKLELHLAGNENEQ